MPRLDAARAYQLRNACRLLLLLLPPPPPPPPPLQGMRGEVYQDDDDATGAGALCKGPTVHLQPFSSSGFKPFDPFVQGRV
jgi:hypothetical protein